MSNVFYASLGKDYRCVDYAKGSYVYDTEGKQYLDCAAGIAVANIDNGYGAGYLATQINRLAEGGQN